MKKLILAAALCTTAVSGIAPAFAQEAPPPSHGKHIGPDANGDGVVTREEALAAANGMFARLDTNKDGQLSPDEMKARHHRRGGHHRMNPEVRKAMLDRFDTNKDGTLSPEERQAARAAWAEKRGQKAKPDPERGAKREARKQARFAKLDSDGNGTISQVEFRAAALKRFERADANHDGRIDKAEHDAMRAKWKEHHPHRRGNMPPPPPAGAVPPPPPADAD